MSAPKRSTRKHNYLRDGFKITLKLRNYTENTPPVRVIRFEFGRGGPSELFRAFDGAVRGPNHEECVYCVGTGWFSPVLCAPSRHLLFINSRQRCAMHPRRASPNCSIYPEEDGELFRIGPDYARRRNEIRQWGTNARNATALMGSFAAGFFFFGSRLMSCFAGFRMVRPEWPFHHILSTVNAKITW
jgi:hypothetical protein